MHTDLKLGKNKQDTKKFTKIAYANLLPDAIIHKMKTGWTVPIGYWLTRNTDTKLQNFYQKRMQDQSKINVFTASQKAGKALVPAWIFKDWMIKYKMEW